MCKSQQVLLLVVLCMAWYTGQTQNELLTESKWPNPTERDWLLDATPFKAGVFKGQANNTLSLPNGLIRRTSLLQSNLATIGLDNLMHGENLLRGVKPEAIISINDISYAIGGLTGQANYAFLRSSDLKRLPLNKGVLLLQNYSVLGGGLQTYYRGPRLFDTDKPQQMVSQAVSWFKEHRDVLEGDIIHLRRADGRNLDYWLNVKPEGEEKGLLMVFNPLDHPVSKTLDIPLYYT